MKRLLMFILASATLCFGDSLQSNITEIQKSLSIDLDEQDFRFASGVLAFTGAAEIRQKYRGLSENLVRCGYENPSAIILSTESMKLLCPETTQALVYWAGVESNAEESPTLKRLVEIQMMAGAGFIVRSGQLKASAK